MVEGTGMARQSHGQTADGQWVNQYPRKLECCCGVAGPVVF